MAEQELDFAASRRQRAFTLAISEFAASITSLGEEDVALHRLVVRTRSLLEVDIAYVSRVSPSGESYIVETDGVLTSAFRNLRLPIGAGVLGRIVATGGAVQTEDYAAEADLHHDAEIDAIVDAEGTRAFLGAPLRIGGRVVGALLVANRSPHRFTAEQLFLVQSLANLAAVALDNAERHGAVARELERVRGELAESETARALAERSIASDDALIDTLTLGGDLAELRQGMSVALGRPVTVVDLTVRFDVRDDAAAIGDAERPLIALSARSQAPTASVDEHGRPFSVMTAVRGGEPVGAVVVEGELDAADDLVLIRCARMLGAYLSARDRERGDFARRRRELVDLLLAPPPSGFAVGTIQQFADAGVRAGEPFRVVLATGSEASLRDFDHRLELDFGLTLLRARIEDELIAVVPERAFAQIERELAAPGARRRGGLLVGYSARLHRLDIVPDEYALVQRVLDAARRSGHQQTLVSLESYGAIGAFLSRLTIEPTRQAIIDTIGPLLDYDAQHGTELVDTATAYLESGHSVGRAAQALRVHDNTVRQRLERIAVVLGEDWAVGQRGLDHHIMLAANRLVGD